MTTYDPRELGADCANCPLAVDGAPSSPLPPVRRANPLATLVVAAPSGDDLKEGHLLSGTEGVIAATAFGGSLEAFDVVSAVACGVAGGKGRASGSTASPPSAAVDACRRRLVAEVNTTNIVTLGSAALDATLNDSHSLEDERGRPMEVGPCRILPMAEPVTVVTNPRTARTFEMDAAKALRWFADGLNWRSPDVMFNPPVEMLRAFLSEAGPSAIDVETTLAGPLDSVLKILGIAHGHRAVVIRFASVEGPGGSLVIEPAYRSDEWEEVKELLRTFLTNPARLKVGHNAVAFDAAVLERALGVVPAPMADTMLMHRAVAPDEPHDLGFLGSIYTDAPAWKGRFDFRSDEGLGRYCATDCAVTLEAFGRLRREIAKQVIAVEHDHSVQGVYRGMFVRGVAVAGLEEMRARLLEKLKAEEAALKSAAPDANTATPTGIRTLLFETLALAPVKLSAGGLPSIDFRSLQALERGVGADDSARTIVRAMVRRAKLRFLLKDLDALEPRDGRLHLPWSVRGEAAPEWVGHLFRAGADRANGASPAAPSTNNLVTIRLDQPRLRWVAKAAGMMAYAEALGASGDALDLASAELIWGPAVQRLTGDAKANALRLARDVADACLAEADGEAAVEALFAASNVDGTLRHPSLTSREAAILRRKWLSGVPSLWSWREGLLEQARAAGAVVEPLLGRRRELGEDAVAWVIDTVVRTQGELLLLGLAEAGEAPVGHWGDVVVLETADLERTRANVGSVAAALDIVVRPVSFS